MTIPAMVGGRRYADSELLALGSPPSRERPLGATDLSRGTATTQDLAALDPRRSGATSPVRAHRGRPVIRSTHS